MPRNTLEDLKNHLFEQIERVRDAQEKDSELDLDQELKVGKQLGDLGKQIVEIEKTKTIQANILLKAGFQAQVGNALVQTGDMPELPNGE